MSKFTVLRASSATDAVVWDYLIDRLPPVFRDIHFTCAYARVQERLGGEALLLVFMDDDEDFVMQPVIRRPTPWLNAFDITSPQWFGGPVSNLESVSDLIYIALQFDRAKTRWAMDTDVICEFAYLHPLFNQHQAYFMKSRFVRETVLIDLANFSDNSPSRRIRRGIRKAREAGKKTSVRSADWDLAVDLYNQSMQRKDAAGIWRLPKDYLFAFRDDLPSRLYTVDRSRALIVAGGYGTAYSMFLGSDGKDQDGGLDALLYFDAARHLCEQGYDRFFLGGGMSSDPKDSLLLFKAGFSTNCPPLKKFTAVFNTSTYLELTEMKCKSEEVYFRERSTKTDFFPQYRRPV